MKSIIALVAALALSGALTSVAQAAPMKAKAAKTAHAKKASTKGKKKLAAKKQKVSDVSSVSSSAASEAQMTETAKLSEVKPQAQAKKWGGILYSESYAPIETVNKGEVGLKSAKLNDGETDYMSLVSYKIADTMTVSGAVEWGQMWGGHDSESSTTLYDPSIRISKSKLADLGNGVGLDGQARLYFPVSQSSQDKEQLAQIRLYATASRQISKALTASFTLNPRIYLQQNDTYVKADGSQGNVESLKLDSYAGLKYSFNDMFSIEQTFGVYQKWITNTPRGDFLDVSTSAYFAPANWVELNFGIRQTDGATDARKHGLNGLYSADQAEYFFITVFSI